MNDESPLTSPVRKGIKIAASAVYIADAIAQMPKPSDFALMITSDILYLTGRVQKLSKNMNKLMETYTDIPLDFISDNINSMFDSSVSLLNKVENRTNNINNYAKGITKMEDDNIITSTVDMFATAEDLIQTTKSNIKYTSELAKLGNEPKVPDAVDALNNYTDNVSSKVTDVTGKAKEGIRGFQTQINEQLANVKKLIKEFSDSIDSAFGIDSTHSSMDSLSNYSNSIDNTSGNAFENMAATAVKSTTGAVADIVKNFSIGKFITGCTGIIATSTLMETGIMNLPRINVEKMLNNVTGKIKVKDKTKEVIDDLIQYDPETFNKYKKSFDDELKKQRNEIKKKLSQKTKLSSIVQENIAYNKAKQNFNNKMEHLSISEKRDIKTAIKEIRKQRKKARNAKIANKIKDIILDELKRFVSDMKVFFKNVKNKWFDMIKRYKDTVKEIKDFFSGGNGSKAVDNICKDINLNINTIIQLCTIDLPVQIANVSVDVALPRAFGMCITNFAQHIVQFFAEFKVIIKFISDLMRCVMNIIRDIKELLQLFFNGLNNLLKIIKDLKDMCSLSWLFKLIKNSKDQANNCIKNNIQILENSLQAIYLKDTPYYETRMEQLENMADIEDDVKSQFDKDSKEEDDPIMKLINEWEKLGNETIVAYKSLAFMKDDKTQEYIYEGNNEETINITDEYGLTDGLDNSNIRMPKIKGYYYFHPDLDFNDYTVFKSTHFGSWFGINIDKIIAKRRRRKHGRYIKKAASRNNQKNGGVAMLNHDYFYHNYDTGINVNHWDAFYWYFSPETENTFYLSEIDKENNNLNDNYIANNISTDFKYGSVVTIDLGNGKKQQLFIESHNVKTGDFVNYNGNRYKIV